MALSRPGWVANLSAVLRASRTPPATLTASGRGATLSPRSPPSTSAGSHMVESPTLSGTMILLSTRAALDATPSPSNMCQVWISISFNRLERLFFSCNLIRRTAAELQYIHIMSPHVKPIGVGSKQLFSNLTAQWASMSMFRSTLSNLLKRHSYNRLGAAKLEMHRVVKHWAVFQSRDYMACTNITCSRIADCGMPTN